MRVEELRINNYYKWIAEGKEYYYKIEPKDFTNDNYKNFEPIELTEEILLKCGFVYISNSVEQHRHPSIFIEELRHEFRIGDFVLNYFRGRFLYHYIGGCIEFKHLHQLQNLYFTLTNEELNVQL